MKKVLMILMMLAFEAVHAQNVLDVVDTQAQPGESNVAVAVHLINPTDPVAGIQFTFHFDTTLMGFIDVQRGQRLSESFDVSYNCLGDSVIVVIVSLSGDSLVPGSGEVAVFHFDISSTASVGDSAVLWLSNPVLSSPQGTHLSVTVDDGVIRIVSQPRVIVQAIPYTVQAGGDAFVPIELQNPEDFVSGIQFTLRFDGSLLTFNSFEDSLPSSFTCASNDFSDSIKVVCVSLSGDSLAPPSNLIGTVNFTVSSSLSPDDSLPIFVDDVVISDPQAQHIPSTGLDGYIGIAPPVPEVLWPASGTFLGTRTFDVVCTSVSGAAAYVVELSNHSDFSFLLDSLELVDTTHSFTVDSDGFYFVRVRSMSSRGYGSDWSPTDSFGVDVTPPSIDSMTVLTDTTWFFGPFEVDAWISDNLSGVGSAWLFYSLDSSPFDSVEMTSNGAMWTGEIPAFSDSANHIVSYFLKALDNSEPANVGISDTVSFTITNIAERNRNLPAHFEVLGIVPNPARNGKTTLKLALPERTVVSIRIYDASGRVVKTLSKEMEAGYASLPLELPTASGVYILKMSTKYGQKTLKVLATHH